MSSAYLKKRNIELLQQEIIFLEKRKTVLYALRSTLFIIAIVFGVDLLINTFFQTKSLTLALQQYNWGRLIRSGLFWFTVNYFWGVRSNKKRLVAAKEELSKRQQETSIQETTS
jgi:hypothetical protein